MKLACRERLINNMLLLLMVVLGFILLRNPA